MSLKVYAICLAGLLAIVFISIFFKKKNTGRDFRINLATWGMIILTAVFCLTNINNVKSLSGVRGARFSYAAATELLNLEALVEGAPFNDSFADNYYAVLKRTGEYDDNYREDSYNDSSDYANSYGEAGYNDETVGKYFTSAYVVDYEDDRGYKYAAVRDVEVSDMIVSSKNTYYGYYATELTDDGSPNLESCWQVENKGDDPSIRVSLEENIKLDCIVLRNGRAYPEKKYEQNCRIKECILDVYDSDGNCIYSEELTLIDQNDYQYILCENMYDVSDISITVKSVYEGSKYNDICLTYVGLYTIE